MTKKNIFQLSLIFLISFIFSSCINKDPIADKKELQSRINARSSVEYMNIYVENRENKLNEYISNLNLAQKIAQLFIINLEGYDKYKCFESLNEITHKDTDKDIPLISGGYLYFSYNIAPTIDRMKAFNKSVVDFAKENNQIVPFLAVDQEGGLVDRLKVLNTPLLSQKRIAETKTVSQAYEIYKSQALFMKDLGFNMNFAPVMEVCTKENEDFLLGRSFGSLENVLKFGKSCVNAYEMNNIAAVVKHFPGNTNTDPHTGLPEILLDKESLFESILPFKEIVSEIPTGILMSHARTSAIDSQMPSCLSHTWVTKILREEFNYKGIIFSDDIFMGALANNGFPPDKAVIMAIEAGIDCIMISEKRFAFSAKTLYEKAISDVDFEKKINDSLKRILIYKNNIGLVEIY